MNLHPEFNSGQVSTILLAFIILTAVIIIAGKLMIRRAANRDLTSKYKNKTWSSPLRARSKYPDVEVFQYRPFALLFGVIGALAFTTALMNWTVVSKVNTDFDTGGYVDMEIEVTPPQTMEPPPPPPPPPPPVVIEVPDELVADMDETVEFLDQSIEAESVVEAPPTPAEPKAKEVFVPPPPPPPKDDVEEIFKVVEEMPRFPGCETLEGSNADKKACSDKELFAFIHANLQYPPYARENNIQGNVVVQFVVNRDGTVQDVQILRDIGAGCGDEVKRVVGLMNQKNIRWTPGKQRGVPVRVMFILPVKFALMSS